MFSRITAVTDPPGYEDHVTWLSSTKYGTGFPITGQGPTFTVQFDDTWGGEGFQWLGVKADGVLFNQDRKSLEPCTEEDLDLCFGGAAKYCEYDVVMDVPPDCSAAFPVLPENICVLCKTPSCPLPAAIIVHVVGDPPDCDVRLMQKTSECAPCPSGFRRFRVVQ